MGFGDGPASRGGDASPSKPGSPMRTTGRRTEAIDQPSIKYKDIDGPTAIVLVRAASPPKPTLPRHSQPRSWAATQRERYPLTASLTGPGRAGKYGELLGENGGKYNGEVLAGRPHGHGTYFTQKPNGEWVMQYEGDWVQGRREGQGVRHYANGEVYTGDFVAGMRHGMGRFEFANGDVYSGQWTDDKRTGHGTLYTASGDIFVGSFIKDRREGLGTLYMMDKQKKYIAEYVNGAPKCGTYMEIEDADLQPLEGALAHLALHKKLDKVAHGEAIPKLPELKLQQPCKVLAEQVVAVRKDRAAAAPELRALQAASGTLGERDIEMLRHSFTLMAAGDDIKVGLLPHQLRELCVMAGLDPASSITRGLVEQLVERRDPATNRITFDQFMKVCVFFQDEAAAQAAAQAVQASLEATGVVATAGHATDMFDAAEGPGDEDFMGAVPEDDAEGEDL